MTTQNVKPRWSLTEGGCLQETYPMLNMFYSCKKAIFRKKSLRYFGSDTLYLGKFPSLVLSRNVIMIKHLIISFSLYFLSSGHSQEVLPLFNFSQWQEVVARDFKCTDLTWKLISLENLSLQERWLTVLSKKVSQATILLDVYLCQMVLKNTHSSGSTQNLYMYMHSVVI